MDTQRTKRIMSILANGKTDRIGQGLMDTVIDIVTADEDNLDFLIDKLLRLIQRAQPEDKFWVAAVEALMVANFEQAGPEFQQFLIGSCHVVSKYEVWWMNFIRGLCEVCPS